VPLLVLGFAVVAAAGLIFWETRGQALYADEFGILVRYRGIDPGVLLQPQAGNLFVVGILIYKAIFAVFGAESYLPIRVLHIVLASTCAVLFFWLARRRVGDWLALAPTVVLLFLGSASEILATPFGSLGLVSIAFGLAMFLALERGDRFGDGLAALMLTVSLAAYSIGAAFAVAAFVEVLTRDAERREKVRSWALLAIPLVLYAIWRLWAGKYGNSNFSLGNLGELPSSMFTSFAAAVGAITGLYRDTNAGGAFTLAWARPAAAGLAVLVVLRLRRGPPVDRRFWVMLAALLAFWALVALNLGPQRAPEASRYLYLSAVLMFLAGIELVRGFPFSRLAVGGIVVAVGVSLLANIVTLNEGANQFRSAAQILRADLAAAEIARDDVDPQTPILQVEPVPVLRDLILPTGAYLSAADKFGSPAYSVAELESASDLAKQSADAQLARLLGLQTVPADARQPALGKCLRSTSTHFFTTVATGGITVLAEPGPPVTLELRRFAREFVVQLRGVAGGSAARISIPPDSAPEKWQLRGTSTSGQRVQLCSG
jgi:hypothetical protein